MRVGTPTVSMDMGLKNVSRAGEQRLFVPELQLLQILTPIDS